jgi:hypothetical protein
MCRARRVHREQVRQDVAERRVAFVGPAQRDLRHRVVEDASCDRMALCVVRVEQAVG